MKITESGQMLQLGCFFTKSKRDLFIDKKIRSEVSVPVPVFFDRFSEFENYFVFSKVFNLC